MSHPFDPPGGQRPPGPYGAAPQDPNGQPASPQSGPPPGAGPQEAPGWGPPGSPGFGPPGPSGYGPPPQGFGPPGYGPPGYGPPGFGPPGFGPPGFGPPGYGPPGYGPPGYGPPQGAPFGSPHFVAQQPWGRPGFPRQPQQPSTAAGVIAILAAVLFGLIPLMIWLTQSYSGFVGSFFASLFVAGTVWLFVFGVARVSGKKLPSMAHVGILAGITVLCTAIGPSTSNAYQRSSEETAWKKVSKETSRSTDFTQYETTVPADFRRPTWRNALFLAKVREVKMTAKGLRDVLQSIAAEPNPERVEEAKTAATKALASLYDSGKARLYAPPKSGATPEFEVDESLRRGFGVLLAQLAAGSDPNVYVAFTSTSDLDPPKGTKEAQALYASAPKVKAAFPKGNVPVIEAGPAFTPQYDQRRRSTFLTAMSGSFATVFDAELLTLVPLEKNVDRKGKLVIEVSSKITREPSFFIYSETSETQEKVAGLLFAINVEWQFRILDRDGKVLYEAPLSASQSASKVHVDSGENDPQWAMYSVMMDSAYYNYCREVTGKFGFTPPPVQETFKYTPN